MKTLEVKVSRQWNAREIVTVVRATDSEIAITMPLPEFLELVCKLAAEKLAILSTRAQMQSRVIEAATEAVAQMKENTRQVMTQGVSK